MSLQFKDKRRLKFRKSGRGVVNSLLNRLPVELHIPKYNFCGPGTDLKTRLARGDVGINPLDDACKQHDIAYTKYTDLENRHKADAILADAAKARFRASDASIGEKMAALGVRGVMKLKTKLGMGIRKRKRHRKRGKGISFHKAVASARKGLTQKHNLKTASQLALSAIKKKKIQRPRTRIIPVPKTGGFLPLIPIFAGLSALGALTGGVAGIVKAVNETKDAKQKLEEAERHNQTMEAIAIGKGLYLRPYKNGCGLYLKPKNC